MSLQTCFLNSLFKQRRCFVLYSFQPPCVVVVNMEGKSSKAADAVKREVKLEEKLCYDLDEDSVEDRSQLS